MSHFLCQLFCLNLGQMKRQRYQDQNALCFPQYFQHRHQQHDLVYQAAVCQFLALKALGFPCCIHLLNALIFLYLLARSFVSRPGMDQNIRFIKKSFKNKKQSFSNRLQTFFSAYMAWSENCRRLEPWIQTTGKLIELHLKLIDTRDQNEDDV